MLPAMKTVFSKVVQSIGYDAEKAAMYVKWRNGKISVYTGVPPDIAESVMSSPSIGQAVAAQIKGKYSHGYVN